MKFSQKSEKVNQIRSRNFFNVKFAHPNAGPRTKHASNMPMNMGADVLETLSSSSVVPSVVRAAAPIPCKICAAMNTY